MSEKSDNSNTKVDTHTAEKEDNTNTDTHALKYEKRLLEIRRARVLELWAQGWSQTRIAEQIKVAQSTVSEDISWIRETSRDHSKAFAALDLISAKAWDTANTTKDEKVRIQALSLVKETEKDKIDIVSNVDVVDKIISITEDQNTKKRDSSNISIAKQEQTEEIEEKEEVEAAAVEGDNINNNE